MTRKPKLRTVSVIPIPCPSPIKAKIRPPPKTQPLCQGSGVGVQSQLLQEGGGQVDDAGMNRLTGHNQIPAIANDGQAGR